MATIIEEQRAFDEQLEALLPEHAGQYILFKEGKPVAFFPTHEAAYEAGLDRFGLDDLFLVAPVEKQDPHPISIAWEAGIMFG